MHRSSLMHRSLFPACAPLAILGAMLALTACKGPGPKKIGEATLAHAKGFEPIPEAAKDAPVVEIIPDQPATIPEAPIVKLAIDRDATWGQVKASLDIIDSRDQTAVFLVAKRRKVHAFRLSDEFEPGGLEVTAYDGGKVCVRKPDIPEAKCAQTGSGSYIDGSFTRQLVREAVKGYQISDIDVDLPASLDWDDVVRVIDGARTCCGDDVEVRVAIRPPEYFPERVEVLVEE
ncbi:MAG: hypothetical protein Tsb0020_32400 [Haliangiales bacterium]